MNILITGGAGFIGVNLAHDYLQNGHSVTVFDNLSRLGSSINLEHLRSESPNFRFHHGDIRSRDEVASCFKKNAHFDIVYHLASQVAVTNSVAEPRNDFEVNALGSLNILEAVKEFCPEAILLYSSTNKVYGKMDDLAVKEQNGRYEYSELNGVPESRPLDFHSPYGCSKGCADQYFIDYSRIYGLKTVVMRQSCIYGYNQFGVEDQGWVAWFTIATYFEKKVHIYGDGKQVRDVLFIDDLIEAYKLAADCIDTTNGNAYNIGGGTFNLSLLELIKYLEDCFNRPIPRVFEEWRPGDQKVFISDITKAASDFNWRPKIDAASGIKKLVKFVSENSQSFKAVGII
ncbi:MAG: GDP-mannose 4,6-dehydratase [Oligoflexales bacterium]|nr:GDP-mannose 4,6-dehydratase [Oligoflexales bacterium]